MLTTLGPNPAQTNMFAVQDLTVVQGGDTTIKNALHKFKESCSIERSISPLAVQHLDALCEKLSEIVSHAVEEEYDALTTKKETFEGCYFSCMRMQSWVSAEYKEKVEWAQAFADVACNAKGLSDVRKDEKATPSAEFKVLIKAKEQIQAAPAKHNFCLMK